MLKLLTQSLKYQLSVAFFGCFNDATYCDGVIPNSS